MCCSLKLSSFEVVMFSSQYHFLNLLYVCISSIKFSFISNQKFFAICSFRVNLLFFQILPLPKSNFERTFFRITTEYLWQKAFRKLNLSQLRLLLECIIRISLSETLQDFEARPNLLFVFEKSRLLAVYIFWIKFHFKRGSKV